jgi:hypothetical protein
MPDNEDFVYTRLGQAMYSVDHATNAMWDVVKTARRHGQILEAKRIEDELKAIYTSIERLQKHVREA